MKCTDIEPCLKSLMKLNTNHVLNYDCDRHRVQAVAKDQSRIFLKRPDRRRSTLD